MKKPNIRKWGVLLSVIVFVTLQLLGALPAKADSSTYTGWKDGDTYHLYLQEDGTSSAKIAYCYDPGGSAPPSEGFAYSYFSSTVSNDQIRSVMWSGYPLNKSGLMEAFGLSEDVFRKTTQRAIWTLRGGNSYWYGVLGGLNSEAEELCYNLLRGEISSATFNGKTITLTTVPNDFVVKLYTNGYYQTLLTADYVETYPVYFSKQDGGGNELAGATIELQDSTGKVLKSWVSDGSAYRFEVETGSYKLVETAAPDGYALASEISFTVDSEGVVTCGELVVTSDAPIVMIDQLKTYPVYFSKQDGSGNELAGATIELQDSTGKVLKSWVSDGSAYRFEVETGSYKLVETAAPDGYALASEISFTVDSEGVVTCGELVVTSDAPIVMVDQLKTYPVYFSKQDGGGNELAGATIELQDSTGKVLKSWISDGSAYRFEVETGSYKLVETAAPDGYALASEISFTVDSEGVVTCGELVVTSDAPIVMVDQIKIVPHEEENPQTGLDSSLWLAMAGLMGSLTGMILWNRRRRKA